MDNASFSSYMLSRTLAIGSCKSEKRAAKLHLASCSAAAINFELFGIFFSNDHGQSFPTFTCRDRELDLHVYLVPSRAK